MPALRILHVLNYGWPHIDGYTVRSQGLITAQKRHLSIEAVIVTSPFTPLASAADRAFSTPAWGEGIQIETVARPSHAYSGLTGLERPGIGLSPYTSAVFRQRLHRVVERLQPDVIHAHHPHYVGAAAQRVARRHHLPCLYELRCFNGDYDRDRVSSPFRRPYYQVRGWHQNRLERRTCRSASAVVTISDGLARRIEAAGVPSDRVFVVRNSVPTDLFSGRVAEPPGQTLRIGYATTFAEMEGLDLLVRSIPAVVNRLRTQDRDLRVTLAGDGPDWPRIRRLVDDLGVGDTVKLPGFIPYDQMPDFYRSLDLFVVPRRPAALAEHTTPLKPLEALAMGRPLLVSDLPALRELLGQRPGVRFSDPTPEALAQSLLAFHDQPWSTTADVVADRSWEREVQRYAEIYARLAPSFSSASPPRSHRKFTKQHAAS